MDKDVLKNKLHCQCARLGILIECLEAKNEINLTKYDEVIRELEALSVRLGDVFADGSEQFKVLAEAACQEYVCLPDLGETNENRKHALKRLRDFSQGANSLIVIDPYIYSGHNAIELEEYTGEFSRAARISSPELQQLHIVFNSSHGGCSTRVQTAIRETAVDSGKSFTEKDTPLIHNRIWVADHSRAVLVGASFNGLGKRLSFITELHESDLHDLLCFLDNMDN